MTFDTAKYFYALKAISEVQTPKLELKNAADQRLVLNFLPRLPNGLASVLISLTDWCTPPPAFGFRDCEDNGWCRLGKPHLSLMW
jgi:hypothetical protein